MLKVGSSNLRDFCFDTVRNILVNVEKYISECSEEIVESVARLSPAFNNSLTLINHLPGVFIKIPGTKFNTTDGHLLTLPPEPTCSLLSNVKLEALYKHACFGPKRKATPFWRIGWIASWTIWRIGWIHPFLQTILVENS